MGNGCGLHARKKLMNNKISQLEVLLKFLEGEDLSAEGGITSDCVSIIEIRIRVLLNLK